MHRLSMGYIARFRTFEDGGTSDVGSWWRGVFPRLAALDGSPDTSASLHHARAAIGLSRCAGTGRRTAAKPRSKTLSGNTKKPKPCAGPWGDHEPAGLGTSPARGETRSGNAEGPEERAISARHHASGSSSVARAAALRGTTLRRRQLHRVAANQDSAKGNDKEGGGASRAANRAALHCFRAHRVVCVRLDPSVSSHSCFCDVRFTAVAPVVYLLHTGH